MNNRELKDNLNKLYPIKSSIKKEIFLKQFKKTSISDFEYIFLQIRYIRFSTLVINLIFLIFSYWLLMIKTTETELIVISSFIPFLVLSLISEINRSNRYQMEEIESVTRFSLKNLLLSKMLIIGLLNFVTILLFFLILRRNISISLINTITLLFSPYLFNTAVSFAIFRRNRENGFKYCLIFAFTTAIVTMYVSTTDVNVVNLVGSSFKTTMFLIVFFFAIFETVKFIKKLGGYLWS